MATSDSDWEEHKCKLSAWIRDKVGIPDPLLNSLESPDARDDWSFIIKIHGIIEAALSHMILGRLREPKLSNIVSHLETNDPRTGKMAFVKTLDLLPERNRIFVRLISELRNQLVHDIRNFDFNFDVFLSRLDKNQAKQWKTGLTCGIGEPVPQNLLDFSFLMPRFSTYMCLQSLLFHSFSAQPETQTDWMITAFRRALKERAESIAKE